MNVPTQIVQRILANLQNSTVNDLHSDAVVHFMLYEQDMINDVYVILADNGVKDAKIS